MKHTFFGLLLVTTGFSSAWAQQEKDVQELLKASGCMTCHSVTEKIVGPAFQSIATKYAGQADAVDNLAQSVRNGSRGKWGRIPMPPHGSLADKDLKSLVTWVLAQKP